jgi:hypothetical protein
MPEKCRVGICGFDPMLVKGYIALNMRAIWFHISDELYEEFDMKPGMMSPASCSRFTTAKPVRSPLLPMKRLSGRPAKRPALSF